MKKKFFSILMVVATSMALVACGSQTTNVSVPETTETVAESEIASSTDNEVVEDVESTEATSTPDSETVEDVESTEVVETETTESVEEPKSTSTPDNEVVEPETEPVAPVFSYTDLNATKYAQQTVNVRDLPSTDGNKIGSLSTNDEITITGQCNETGWFRFVLNGSDAYVSNKYVGDNKVEKPAASETSSNGGGKSSSGAKNWQDYYQDHVWYDEGDFMFIILNDMYEGGSGFDYSGAQATLQGRYPGESITLGCGGGLRDGHWMFFAFAPSAIDKKTAFINQFK